MTPKPKAVVQDTPAPPAQHAPPMGAKALDIIIAHAASVYGVTAESICAGRSGIGGAKITQAQQCVAYLAASLGCAPLRLTGVRMALSMGAVRNGIRRLEAAELNREDNLERLERVSKVLKLVEGDPAWTSVSS